MKEIFMKKTVLRIALAVMAAIAACLCLFAAACADGSENEKTNTYSVTVVYSDGSAVNGTTDGVNPYDSNDKQITVQWCLEENGVLGTCYPPVALGADGKASTDTLPALNENQKYHIQLNYAPGEYTDVSVSATGDVTITVTKS